MVNNKIKWLIYTVLVGLIPILCRLLIWGVTSPGTVSILATPDIVAFGLIMHISNINEIEHIADSNLSWKTVQNGISILFIALYSVLFALVMLSESLPKLIDSDVIKGSTIFLACVSFLISFSVFDRIAKSYKAETGQ